MADGFTRLSNAGSNYDADGYLLDENGQRATVGNRNAVLAAVRASAPAVVARDSAADEANAEFNARQLEQATKNEDERLRNLNPQQRLQEREVREGRQEKFQREQFDYGKHQDEVRNQFAQHSADLADATTYAEMSAKKIAMQNAVKEQLDTGDFLNKAHTVALSDPQYSEKIGGFLAEHPHVPTQVVNSFMATNQERRQIYLSANQAGGASEFAPGPVQDAYTEAFKKTGDPAQAKAVAGNVAKGEAMLDKGREDGLFLPEHLDPDSKNNIYTPDGHVDYTKASRILDTRRGEIAGIEQTQTRKQVDEARQLITLYADPLKRAQGGPKVQALYDDAVDFVLQHRLQEKQKRAGKAGAPAAPPPGTDSLDQF